MAREPSPHEEMRDAMRREAWTLAGPSRIVKVQPIDRPMASVLHGFICLEKSLLRKTPQHIEEALGVEKSSLAHGCRVYRFKRLPTSSEVDYELSAAFPHGLSYNPVHHSSLYPPGDATIHQWRLLADLPVVHLLDLMPGQPFPYLNR